MNRQFVYICILAIINFVLYLNILYNNQYFNMYASKYVNKYVSSYVKYKYVKTLKKITPFVVRIELKTDFNYTGELDNLIVKAVESFINMFKNQIHQEKKILLLKGNMLDMYNLNITHMDKLIDFKGFYDSKEHFFNVLNLKITDGHINNESIETMIHELFHALIYQGLRPSILKSITPYLPIEEGITEQLTYSLLYKNDIYTKISMLNGYEFSSFNPSVHMLKSPRNKHQAYINNYMISHIFLKYLFVCEPSIFYQVFSENTYKVLKEYTLKHRFIEYINNNSFINAEQK